MGTSRWWKGEKRGWEGIDELVGKNIPSKVAVRAIFKIIRRFVNKKKKHEADKRLQSVGSIRHSPIASP
jgi:hypothetical protein